MVHLDLEQPYEDDEPMNLEENKENEIPEIDSTLKEELSTDEKEILEIYQDLDRHMKLIEDKQPQESETPVRESTTEEISFPIQPEPEKKEIVFKPTNIIKKLYYEPPPKLEPLFPDLSILDGYALPLDSAQGSETASQEESRKQSMAIGEEDDDYPRVSVKELIHSFENVKQIERVHLKKVERLIKESSTESEVSEGKHLFCHRNRYFFLCVT